MLQMIFSLSETAIMSVLSINKEKMNFSLMTFSFLKMLCVKITFLAVLKVIIYLALVIKREMLSCLTNYQYTDLSVSLIKKLVIDLFSLTSLAQSASE